MYVSFQINKYSVKSLTSLCHTSPYTNLARRRHIVWPNLVRLRRSRNTHLYRLSRPTGRCNGPDLTGGAISLADAPPPWIVEREPAGAKDYLCSSLQTCNYFPCHLGSTSVLDFRYLLTHVSRSKSAGIVWVHCPAEHVI